MVGEDFIPETSVEKMLESSSSWSAISTFVDLVLTTKEDEERVLQRRLANNIRYARF